MRQGNLPVSWNQQLACRFLLPYYSMPSYWTVQDCNIQDIFSPFPTQAFMPGSNDTNCVSQRVDSLSPLKFFTKGQTDAVINSLAEQNNYNTYEFQCSQNQFQIKIKQKNDYEKAKSKAKNHHQSHKKKQEELQLSQQSSNSQARNFSNKLRQKFGRNIRSNIFHLMLNKIIKEDFFDSKIQSIIQKFNLSFGPRQFKLALNKKVKKLASYISVKKMQQLNRSLNSMSIENGSSFSLIFKILCRLYLSNEHIIHIYNSRKIKESSKRIHIRETRSLLNEIL